MANGVIGKIGHHVRPRVELEHRNVSARVPSHAQLLAGKIALVLVGRANHVKEYPVQVKSWFQYPFLSVFNICKFLRASDLFGILKWFKFSFFFFLFCLPVDGGWTDWEDWTLCSRTCGTGSQERVRSCTKPRPAFGGKDCAGVSRETKSCQARACPGKNDVLTFSIEARFSVKRLHLTNICLSIFLWAWVFNDCALPLVCILELGKMFVFMASLLFLHSFSFWRNGSVTLTMFT